MTFKEAERITEKMIKSMQMKFCPLIGLLCKHHCVCFEGPKIGNIVDGRVQTETPAEIELEGYCVIGGYCSNYSLTGVKKEE